ncbi:hypothetical protein RIF23_01200 [Lipingzhangella sp. LS1_29]|uniref:Thioesterase superfamily protein n=1 Tax=Lipingzhangella rawalii TaxID=2055835 RepID=A0ABU2H215_9ACTN|nr:hypothetical protein [Lipingzhangella rawalii]MDS1268905.1 hypothetical protein [Lipingzhangella rawalii]
MTTPRDGAGGFAAADSLVIPPRFNGPTDSANGGYASGLLAQKLVGAPGRAEAHAGSSLEGMGAVRVRLHAPPPLGTSLTVIPEHDGAAVRLWDQGRLIAEATPDIDPQTRVPWVALPEARAAERRFRGATEHPFPTCFACGPERAAGDGLALAPGPVDGAADHTACVWTPPIDLVDTRDAHLSSGPAVWAALDCPGGWTSDIVGRPMVLGQMTTRIWRHPHIGRAHIVTGRQLAVDGRKVRTATTLHDENGAVLATAEHVWIILREGAQPQ